MKALLTLSFALMVVAVQVRAAEPVRFDLKRVHVKKNATNEINSYTPPCSPGYLTVDCRGSQRDDPFSRRARFEISASGGSLYYLVLTKSGVDYVITDPTTGSSLFRANGSGSYSWDIPIEREDGQFAGQCLPPGDWTARVYDVVDADGDGQPDKADGMIAGCYEECSFDLYPPCPNPFVTAFTVAPKDVSCFGNDGAIRLFDFNEDIMYCVDQSGAGASFSWRGPDGFTADTEEVTGLSPGFYRVTVTDYYDCTFIWRREISELAPLVFRCEEIPPAVPGTASISFEIIGGLPPYRLSYTRTTTSGNVEPTVMFGNVEDGFVLNNLGDGQYSFTLTDANNCEEFCSKSFCTVAPTCTPTNVATLGGTGSVDLALDGLAPWDVRLIGPLSTEFQTSETLVTIDDLPPGSYQVELSDRLGCPGSCSFLIEDLVCSLTADPVAVDISCFGEDNGSIDLGISGDINGVTIDWGDPRYDGRSRIDNLSPGSYRAMVIDGAMCTVGPFEFVINEPEELEVSLEVTQQLVCSGDTTGALLSVTGNIEEPATYTWSEPGFPNQPTVENLNAGTYSVTVTDVNGCRGEASIVLTEPEPVVLNCNAVDESVSGLADGTITISTSGEGDFATLTGDLGTFTISLNMDTTFTDLPAGIYRMQITDASGCTDNCSSIVNSGTCQVTAMADVEQPDCDSQTGIATAIPGGGTGPYSFAWSTGDRTPTLGGLAPGNYELTVTDREGCSENATFIVEEFQLAPSLIALPIAPSCAGECIEISLVLAELAPFTLRYRFSDSRDNLFDRDLTISESGILTFCPQDFGLEEFVGGQFDFRFLTDVTGCNTPLNLSVPVPIYPSRRGLFERTLCDGEEFSFRGTVYSAANPTGSVVLENGSVNGCDSIVDVRVDFLPPATGSYSETLCPGDTLDYFGTLFYPGRTAGTVVLPAASSTGCDSTVSVSIDYYQEASGSYRDTVCVGDTLFYQGVPFHAGRPNGDVVLPGASATGCDSTVSVSVDFYPIAAGFVSERICPGDTLDFFGSLFHAGNTAGTVVLPNASVNGCDSTIDININFYPAAFDTLRQLTCRGDSVIYQGVTLTEARPMADVVLANASANGCDSTVTVIVSFLPNTSGTIDTLLCPGDTLMVGDTRFAEPVTAQRVTLPGAGELGCDSLVDVTVRYGISNNIRLYGDGSMCPSSPIDLSLDYDGPEAARVVLSSNIFDTLTLAPGTNTFSKLVPQGANIIIRYADDVSTCAPSPSGNIMTVLNEIDVRVAIDSMAPEFALSCANATDGRISAAGSGGIEPYTYSWSNGESGPTVSGLRAGNYRVTATSARGCTAIGYATLDAPPPVSVEAEALDLTCTEPVPRLLINGTQGGSPPYVYDTGEGFKLLENDTLAVKFGETLLRVEDSNGCGTDARFTFEEPEPPTLTVLPPASVINYGDSLRLDFENNFGATRFVVIPGAEAGTPLPYIYAKPTVRTTYYVTATNPEGCVAQDSARVVVDRAVRVYAPNAFSPNDDRSNPLYRLYGHHSVISFSDFAIYDRWGNQVYFVEGPIPNDGPEWGWDGNSLGGTPHEQGLYVYTVTVRLQDEREVALDGELLLVR